MILAYLVLCLITPFKAHAQGTSTILLNNMLDAVYIGEQIYVTDDKSGSLSAKTLAVRHKNNLRGTRNDHKVLHLKQTGRPAWLVFSVENLSHQDNWTLHLGSVASGRQAFINKILVQDSLSTKPLIDIGFKEEDIIDTSKILYEDGIQLSLPKNEVVTFMIQLNHKGPFPATLTPTLIKSSAYISTLDQTHIPARTFNVIALILIGFIVALSATQIQFKHLYLAAYTILQVILLHLLSHNIIAHNFISELATLILIASSLMLLGGTELFVSKRSYSETAKKTFVILGGVSLCSFIATLFMSEEHISISTALTFFPIMIGSFIGLFFSALLVVDRRYDGIPLCASWLVWICGLSMLAALNFNIITANAFNTGLYWAIIPLQIVLYMAAALYKIQLDIQENERLIAKEKRAARSKARLQQSKEFSDQSRLLRVIERERELMAELREREIQRTEEMRVAKNMADEANRAKSAFLAVVSHEVRTPMNGIMGMVRLLIDTQMTKQQNEYLQAMQTSGETMMALLNDILDFEKIESGKMTLELIDFDMSKLVQDTITLMTGHAAEKETTLTSKIPANFPSTLRGDPTRLRQVLLNLVSNAIKFTEKGQVTIVLKATPIEEKASKKEERQKYKIICAVEDTGIGISKEAQETLFTPFTQANESTTRKYGGTGLGLTICRRLIEAMKGQITLESEEGKGSTFSFSLEMEAGKHSFGENAQDIGASAAHARAEPMNILVIDDNEMNRRVLQGFLEKDSHTTTLCENGERGLELCSERAFDIIITDIKLDGMDGIEFTKNLRLFPNQKIASTPVIALSGNTTQNDINEYYQANMNGFLPKPVDPDALNAMLVRAQEQDFDQAIILPGSSTENTQNKAPKANDKPQEKTEEEAPTEDIQVEEISAIEQAALEQEEPKPAQDSFKTFDPKFIEALAGSLPADQLKELMKSCTDKASEIIEELTQVAEDKDLKAMLDKGHELKGMVANFGLTELSEIAAVIEKAGKDEDAETGIEHIKKLPDANRRAEEELNAWIESL